MIQQHAFLPARKPNVGHAPSVFTANPSTPLYYVQYLQSFPGCANAERSPVSPLPSSALQLCSPILSLPWLSEPARKICQIVLSRLLTADFNLSHASDRTDKSVSTQGNAKQPYSSAGYPRRCQRILGLLLPHIPATQQLFDVLLSRRP
jgi:hypothetical protein